MLGATTITDNRATLQLLSIGNHQLCIILKMPKSIELLADQAIALLGF